MEITTVKLYKETKQTLDALKTKNETYDQLVQRLINYVKKKNLRSELIQAYKEMGTRDLALLEEWDSASLETN